MTTFSAGRGLYGELEQRRLVVDPLPSLSGGSDCGSSSGLGGMNKHDMASCSGSSSASDPQPTATAPLHKPWVMVPPALLNSRPQLYTMTVGGPSSAGCSSGYASDPRDPQRQPPASDLYVHVLPGETLSILVGGSGADVQHIAGPATVRMIGQTGVTPAALPLHVPPGHMIQQIVDEQGILRHLILSPETTPSSLIAGATANCHLRGSGANTPLRPFPLTASTSPPVVAVPPYPPPTLTVPNPQLEHLEGYIRQTSDWSPPTLPKLLSVGSQSGVDYNIDEQENSQSGASGAEDEDAERLRDMLSRIQSPVVISIRSREAEIGWQPLDTSEASAPAGPFPQIDPSEFSYEIVLYQDRPEGQHLSNYRCEPDDCQRLRLLRLRPDTDYFVRLRASLEERGLLGEPSVSVYFKTAPAAPEAPSKVQIISRTRNAVAIAWRPSSDNGSRIVTFAVELAKNATINDKQQGGTNETRFDIVWRGLANEARISPLRATSLYLIRVRAINDIGTGDPSAVITVPAFVGSTRSPIRRHAAPRLISTTATTANIAWTHLDNQAFKFMLEMGTEQGNGNETAMEWAPVRQQVAGDTCVCIDDLRSGKEYRFRMVAESGDEGEYEYSETLCCRTDPITPSFTGDAIEKSSFEVSVPKRLVADGQGTVASPLRLSWWTERKAESYKVEIRSSGDDSIGDNWLSICTVSENFCSFSNLKPGCSYQIRVASINGKSQSHWSDVIDVKVKSQVPGRCGTPQRASADSRTIFWTVPDDNGGAEITVYQLENVTTSSIVYSGSAPEYQIVPTVPGGQRLTLRVRAVNENGAGPWSNILEMDTVIKLPEAPTALHLTSSFLLSWQAPAQSVNVVEYRVHRAVIERFVERYDDDENDEGTGESKGDGVFSMIATTSTTHAQLTLMAATTYAFKVEAIASGGIVGPSSSVLQYRTSATPPGLVSQLTARAVSSSELILSWNRPSSNGAPLKQILLSARRISTSNENIAIECSLPAMCKEYTLNGLRPYSTYRVTVQAENEQGVGPEVQATASTMAEPPNPPMLDCPAPQWHCLKLRWSDADSPLHSGYTYVVEKENDNGSFSPVYEGDAKCTKVKNLNENSHYRFRIRSSSREGGLGRWSAPIELRTCRAPPPAVRSAPHVTILASRCFQVEWPAVRPSSSNTAPQQLLYRLQTAPRSASDRSDAWKTVYEGHCLSFTLSEMTSESGLRVRVVAVRICDNGEEACAAPSPSALLDLGPGSWTSSRRVTNSLNSRRAPSVDESTSSSQDEAHSDYIEHSFLSDRYFALLVLGLFTLLIVGLSLLVNTWFS